MEREEREDGAVEDALGHMERAERERAEARELRARADALDARADKEERDAVRDLEGRGHGHGHDHGHGGGGHGQPGHSGGDGGGHGPEPRQVDIVVNGRERKVPPGHVTYERVLELAFGSAATAVTHTVNWRAHDGREGSLLPGGSVAVCEGMIFTATATNRS